MQPSLFSVTLLRSQVLYLEVDPSGQVPHSIAALKKIFDEDWCAGWFHLAAEKTRDYCDATLLFWLNIASHFVTALAHLPEEVTNANVAIPNEDCLREWISKAPPMKGGEYLSVECLQVLWQQLQQWVEKNAAEEGGIHQFLHRAAPKWQQVGRVCFHLAENKQNQERPFAFLATYSTGYDSGGKLRHLPLGQALKQYSGDNNRQALINLLTPVQKAALQSPWVKKLIETAELYQPLAWPINQAYALLSSIPLLEECGLIVRIPNWWRQRRRPQVALTVGSTQSAQLGASTLLHFDYHVALGEHNLTQDELKHLLSSAEPITFFKGEWVEIDKEKLEQALAHWKSVRALTNNGEVSFIEGMRLLAGVPMSTEDLLMPSEELASWTVMRAGDSLAALLRQIKDPSQIAYAHPEGLQATLRPYQQDGVKWLSLLYKLGLGACLADDMGLGKTLQILTLLLQIQKDSSASSHPPSLLIVPASLLENWQQEAAKFTPSLSLMLLHPSQRKYAPLLDEKIEVASSASTYFNGIDVVVTTYAMVSKLKWLAKMEWNLLILDEAQAIKNSDTKQTVFVKKIQSRARIALTGTPIENRLSDLWSLFDFLNPSLLGTAKKFKEFSTLLQTQNTQFEPLRKLIHPYILRRMKTDPKVISDLPDKIETPTYCSLSTEQVKHYQAVVNKLAKNLETVDPRNRRGLVLKTLIELKQICNHPAHYLGTGDFSPSLSGKFERLKQICEELAERQEKVLIFTQFAEIIPYLKEFLSTVFGRQGLILHGATAVKKRKELVTQFQTDDTIPFFILSLKAGGIGLTLTAANHVIHFDRWWNPAVENQATDRAFRIGQKKHVQVHKFITLGTLEEQIDAMISSKAKLAAGLLMPSDDNEVPLTELSNGELIALLQLDINKAMAS